tara:strand:+ start:286 stop:480 length:195 start_codon:yes stop_codon:yes gene_type:complete
MANYTLYPGQDKPAFIIKFKSYTGMQVTGQWRSRDELDTYIAWMKDSYAQDGKVFKYEVIKAVH